MFALSYPAAHISSFKLCTGVRIEYMYMYVRAHMFPPEYIHMELVVYKRIFDIIYAPLAAQVARYRQNDAPDRAGS